MTGALVALALASIALPQEPLSAAEVERFRRELHPFLFGSDDEADEARGRLLSVAAGKDLASALDALRSGPILPDDAHAPRADERRVAYGAVTTGYSVSVDGRRHGYALVVPPGYDPAVPCALLLDPGHGAAAAEDQEGKAGYLDFYRARAEAAGCEDWLLVRTEIVEAIGADGKWGKAPEAEVVPVFLALLRDVSSRYAVDPDRIFVTGLSQTGFWTWVLGAARADRWAGLIPMASVTWQIRPCLENLRTVRAYALHGSDDTVCKTGPAREDYQVLSTLAPDFRYVEVAGAGHDGRVFARVADGLKWMKDARRDPLPRSVSKAVATLHDPWCYWLRIDELTELGSADAGDEPTGGVDAEVDGQELSVWSEGVEGLTLMLSPRMIDLEEKVTVIWNGKYRRPVRVKPDLATALDIARARCDWGAVFPATIELR